MDCKTLNIANPVLRDCIRAFLREPDVPARSNAFGRMLRYCEPSGHTHVEQHGEVRITYACTVDKKYCFKKDDVVLDEFEQFRRKALETHPIYGTAPDSEAFEKLYKETTIKIRSRPVFDFSWTPDEIIPIDKLWTRNTVSVVVGGKDYKVPLHHQAIEMDTPTGRVKFVYNGKNTTVSQGIFLHKISSRRMCQKVCTITLPDGNTLMDFKVPTFTNLHEHYLIDDDIFPFFVEFTNDVREETESDEDDVYDDYDDQDSIPEWDGSEDDFSDSPILSD